MKRTALPFQRCRFFSSLPFATFMAPRELLIGGGTIGQLPGVLKRFGIKRPLIVTDKNMVKLGKLEEICAPLNKDTYGVFDNTVEDPTTDVVENGLNILKSGGFDGMVAIGGGSPIDTAKAVSILAMGGKMRDYKVPFVVQSTSVPLIAIPTTAGTGSEVTRFTVITDTKSNEKMLIAGPGCIPTAAIVDYTLTLSVPFRTTADTGIDTLTHAIEAYVSRKASPLSDSFALQTIRLVVKSLRKACFSPKDEEARKDMMLAATLGGLAFSTASVALVHGMSRPIGALFHVPHGLSNAMLLPYITKFSAEEKTCRQRYVDIAHTMKLVNDQTSEEDAIGILVNFLHQLNKDLKVPSPHQYGIDHTKYEQSLDTMAKQALQSGSPSNNPRIPTHDQIVSLYREAYR